MQPNDCSMNCRQTKPICTQETLLLSFSFSFWINQGTYCICLFKVKAQDEELLTDDETIWNLWGKLCMWESPLCECAHMIACICMLLLAQQFCVSGLWAMCKSLRLGGRQNRSLIPQLFSQPFPSILDHKEMFTVHTQRLRHEDTCTWRAYWQWKGVFLCKQVSSEWSASPQVQLVKTEGVSEGDGEKLHNNSWKLDDCSMCSCLTRDP